MRTPSVSALFGVALVVMVATSTQSAAVPDGAAAVVSAATVRAAALRTYYSGKRAVP
jgi:hypothetical protein